MILTEFDENRNAVFNPHNIIKRKQDFPKIGITCFSKKVHSFYNERVMGIEPTLSAWEAEILPLNYTRDNYFINFYKNNSQMF